ncbi:hypothetical protein BJ322DRAFT_6511 [Thelephora terrestris]|uniref:Uncharacterized protein n=1 Tax=Thelephora terrestris TaxID=56493 RepID=A0A9P6LC13_9AGAM|nr:hypothetical protein BJ322DRAFT_6511 [Thelephora terrestris]
MENQVTTCHRFVLRRTDTNSSARASFLLLTHGQPKLMRRDGRVQVRFGKDVWLEPESPRGMHGKCSDFLSPSFRTDAQYPDEPSPKRGPHEVELSLPSTPTTTVAWHLEASRAAHKVHRESRLHSSSTSECHQATLCAWVRSHFMLAVLMGGDSNSANAERGLVDRMVHRGFPVWLVDRSNRTLRSEGTGTGTENTV